MILVAFSLVLDRAFSHGDLTWQLASAAEDAKRFALRSGGKVADTITGYN